MEFPELGSHCHLESCNTLDFLPFTCSYCSEVHCRAHRQPADHDCQKVPLQHQGSDVSKFQFSCSVVGCGARELVEVRCPQCGCNVCLQHRHPPDHACASLLPQPPSKQLLAQLKVQQIADSITVKPNNKAGHKDPKLAAKVQLMKLKMRAVVCGSKNMVAEERCYLLVLLPLLHTATRSVAICVSLTWSVGRALDAIADVAKVTNNNSSSNNECVLQLYRHCDGLLLPTATQLVTMLGDGRLCNGDTIVLESTARGTITLQNTHLYTIPK